jgi:hypothetical protein
MADSKQNFLIWKSVFKTPPVFVLFSMVTKKTTEKNNLFLVFITIRELDGFITFQHNVGN